MERRTICTIGVALCFFAGSPWSAHPAGADDDPVALVDPFAGTSGTVNAFPGASLPFGMVQWSPDTPSRPPGGGYEYGDNAITGFSLTHLSGPGCLSMGDFPVLPIAGTLANVSDASQPFTHRGEVASPGYYAVAVGKPQIGVELSATLRSGIARFTFPPAAAASVVVNAGGSQAGDSDARFDVISPAEIAGSAVTGHFCGSPDEYTVYFYAVFDRAATSYGTWTGTALERGSAHASGPACGGWLSFDTRANPRVLMKVGISYVSVAGARANLLAEDPGWDFDAVRSRAAQTWRDALSHVDASGATPEQERVFYTALFHALLQPNVFSDAAGLYAGFDGAVHRVQPGHVQYANFSAWDIYRTQLPLIAFLFPHETSDMMQSLVEDARSGGMLPKWPLANTYTDAMNGDSADALFAAAYAFGARSFDTGAALRFMIQGATNASNPPAQGWFIERPDLAEYLRFGYVANTHTNSVSPLPNAASETLEYALDDFCIARFAQALGDGNAQKRFAARSRNWSKLFDSATGLIAPRDADGAFLDVPLTKSGQSGFQEGNAAQYTWLVPFDVRALFDAMGGDTAAVRRLDDFFTLLDAGPGKPYAWLGNEPSILQPWLYLSAGASWKTQAIVRKIETALYRDAPAAEAGNDDLGTMSAWYVWSAIGLYPQTPGVPLLDIGSPLFSHVAMRSEDGRSIDIEAPKAATDAPFVQALRVNGKPFGNSWLILGTGTLRLDFELGTSPNVTWAAAPGDGPPSWNAAVVHTPPAVSAKLALSPSSTGLSAGAHAKLAVVVRNVGDQAVRVAWHAALPSGFTAGTPSGVLQAPPGATTDVPLDVLAGSGVSSGFYNVVVGATAANGAVLQRAIASIQVRKPGETPLLAYVLNFSGASVTPIDLRSRTFGPPIAVQANPGDAAVSADGTMLFVANQGADTVSVIDTRTLSVIRNVAVGKTPAGIRMTHDGKTVWVSDYGDDDVRPIDARTLSAGAPISVGRHPEELAISPDDARLYVVNQGSDSVSVVDLRTEKIAAEIRVGRVPLGIALTPDARMAFVTNMGSNDVTPIDLANDKALARIKVGMAPQQPAVSPDGKTLLVPNSASGDVTPIDVTTMKAGPPVHVGNAPFYVMYTADGRTAYVVASGDNACIPIDTATLRPGTPIATGNFPIAIVR